MNTKEPEFKLKASWPLAGRFLEIYSHVLKNHRRDDLAIDVIAASREFEEYTTELAEECEKLTKERNL